MRAGMIYEMEIGNVVIIENGKAIVFLGIGKKKDYYPAPDFEMKETELLKEAHRQLAAYFRGERTVFDLPLATEGTAFQKSVWKALMEIPYGKTCSYKDIAIRIGNPKAFRAVGMANHLNPISIIIPCHRVIGASGQMVGYGGGLHMKEYLLKLEGSI